MGRKSKELSEDRKQLVVDLKREGHRNCEIVKLLHIPESTIRSIWKKYNSTGNVENIPRVGRPRKVTRRGEVRLLRTVKKNRGKVLREITNDFNEGGVVRVHPKTIQRYLHKNKIFRRVVRKKMVVREVNKKKRLSWCLERRRWTVNLHWNQVIFSDESQIVIGQNNRVYVWRSSNEAYRPECMCPPYQRKVSVMIWGCITWYGVGTLCKVDGNINAVKYRDILDNHLWPVLARHFADKPYRFQDDNAPVHRARIIEEFKRDNDIHGMTWPAQSPDLNIIENVWLCIKRSLQNAAGNINTPQERFTAIQDISMNFTVDYIQNLYTSIPRRILAVIRSNGYLTKY